jgi:hypothetical protein
MDLLGAEVREARIGEVRIGQPLQQQPRLRAPQADRGTGTLLDVHGDGLRRVLLQPASVDVG